MFSKPYFIVAWLLAGIIELPLAVSFGWPQFNFIGRYPLEAFLIHLAASVMMAMAGVQRAQKRLSYWSPTFFFLTFAFPVLGWLFSLVFILYRAPQANPLLEDEESQPAWAPIVGRSKSSRSETILKELDFMPLADILKGDDIELKRGAVEKLADLRTPEAISLLRRYRNDPSPEVRFYVTSSLSRIQKDFDERLEATKTRVREENFSPASRISLAQNYLQMVASQLADETTNRMYENEAKHHLEAAAASPDAPAEAYWLLLQVLERHAQWEKANATLTALEGKADADEITRRRIQLYFNAGMLNEMAIEIKAHPDAVSHAEWSGLVNWWGMKKA